MVEIALCGIIVAAVFVAGSSYGRAQEQLLVSRTLAELTQIDASSKTFVSRFLGFAKPEYSMIYDEIVLEFEKVKKAI